MSRRNRWLWFLFFIVALGIAGSLATSWNWVLVRDYHKLLDTARQLNEEDGPWVGITLGSLGFLALMVSLFVFFIRMQKAAFLSEQQRNFLSRVSHELKTPIATLELTSGLLQKSIPASSETDELWNAHQQELRRLKEQVHLLLESSKIQSEKPRAQRERREVQDLVLAAIQRWRQRLGPEWTVHTQLDPEVHCDLDPKLFDLIIDNLIDNAVKFSAHNRTIYIRTKVENENWSLEVQDLGIGFDAKERRHFFKRFYRGKTETEHAIPGNGLGLFLAQSSAKAMGLRISAMSSGPGKGATFKVSS